ncbi:hypothetical protein TELCIR_21700, partial [Teladorsagia circumcincta]
SLILEAIKTFLNAKLSTSHMKMSVLIENIIEQCEEWEKMADRMNSLRQELAPLRELLVDWKKMEVRSWGELLRRVEKDGQLRTQLVVFPLFDALFKAETDWAQLLGRSTVSSQLHSIGAHFEQYVPLVEQSLREAREPAEDALKDYVKIVKFNDLNLWNIKVSSQKAHTHLFKIIRRFREAVGAQVQPLFDKLVQIDSASVAVLPDLSEVKADGRGRRAVELANTIMAKAATVCDITAAVELAEQTKCCDEAIRVLINYQGEDEEKTSVHKCAGGRNASIRKAIAPNDQLGVATRKHLTGVIGQ